MTMMTFKQQGSQRPTALGTLVQSSAYGATIPVIYGLTQSNLLAIWAAHLRQGGGRIKKFKQLKKGITNYCENIDFLLGHNPIKGVLQVMDNGSNYPLAFTSQSFSGSGGRQSFTVTDANFYFVIAVTVEASYSFSVNDYGGQGPETLAGTWEVPLWNELETGPDPTDPSSYRAWPYCFRWQPGMGATVEIDAEAFPAGTVKVYYAQMTAATSHQPPITRLSLAFEPQLGGGDEYANAGNDPLGHPYSEQQIIYPHFAGLQSSEIDLGASGTLPQLNPEVCGKWGLYPSGDADFADMIEDIFKSGLAQAAIVADTSTQPEPPTTQMERGLSSYDLPGTIQKKIDSSASASLPPMQYNMPNVAGNVLIAVVTGTGTLAISSANGETWTAVYGAAAGYQVWYAYAAGGPNTVTVTGASAPWGMSLFEIGGVGGSIPNQAQALAIAWSRAATGPATAVIAQTTGASTVTGRFGDAILSWNGFLLNPLPAGAVVTSIYAQVKLNVSSAVANYISPSPAIVTSGFGFPNHPVFDGTILVNCNYLSGDPVAFCAGINLSIELDYTLFATLSDFATVSDIRLLVNYTLSTGGLGGDTVDAVVTGCAPAAVSSLIEGLPGYLMAISLYPGGSAPAVSDEALWHASTPANFFDNSPATFQVQERVIYSPGTYPAPAAAGAASVCLIALKAANPVPYPKPLGDFINVPSFDLVRAQCRAGGLWGSLTMNSQSSGADWLKSLFQAADAAPVYLGDQLYGYPYSEVSAAANGVLYTAPTAAGPVANLDADNGDFTGDGPAMDPVDRIDLPNVLQMQCIDRNANYAQVTVQTPDPASLGLYGQRKAEPITNNAVQDPGVARTLLGIAVRRNQYGGDVWSFSTTARWSLLSPMDLVTITDRLQSVVGQPVRITEFSENDNGGFDGKAEPFVYGMCAPTALPATDPTPNTPDPQISAGDVNPPIIFEPTPGLYPSLSGDQLWVVVSSANANFGGAQVFVSTDGGASYNPAPGGTGGTSNVIIGSAVTGALTTDWPAAADPDTTNNLAVDVSESDGVIESISVSAENNFELPCWVEGNQLTVQVNGVDAAAGDPLVLQVNGVDVAQLGTIQVNGVDVVTDDGFGYELMSYAVANLTSANHYTLQATGAGNFLRRAILDAPDNTGAGIDHASGSRFAVLDPSGQGILKMALPSQYISQTLLFKIVSFNTFGAGLQLLSDVTPYAYVPTGIPGAA